MDLEVLHPLCHEQESSLRHLQRNRLSQGRKTGFTCRKAERGQAQPQLYGTSYFFGKMALTGQFRTKHLCGQFNRGRNWTQSWSCGKSGYDKSFWKASSGNG